MARTNNMTKKLTKAASETVKNRFPVVLTEKQAQPYIQQAESLGKAPEDLMAERLTACSSHTAEKPLYFNDDQRRELEKLLEANFGKPEEVINKVRPIAGVTVDGVVVPLNSRQIERLKSRCFFGITYQEKLTQLIHDAINNETGLF